MRQSPAKDVCNTIGNSHSITLKKITMDTGSSISIVRAITGLPEIEKTAVLDDTYTGRFPRGIAAISLTCQGQKTGKKTGLA